MFHYTDPNTVWPMLCRGLNEVINEECPTRVIQRKKSFKPYIKDDIREMYKEAETHLEEGIRHGDNEEFRVYRSIRNKVYKSIETAKRIYFNEIIPNSRNMWNTIKDIAGKKEYTIPKRIIHKGEFHTSQKRIANLMNEFFIEKIDTIEKGF